MRCSNCSKETNDDSKLCNSCGERLKNKKRIIKYLGIVTFILIIISVIGKLTDFTFSYEYYKNNKKIAIDNKLIESIKNNDVKDVEKLIKEGADLEQRDDEKNTPLILSLENDTNDIVKLLIESGADISKINLRSESPLHIAAKNNDTELINLLIDKGADINEVSFGKDTPLLMAVKLNNIDAVQALVERGANVTIKDINGETSLSLASEQKDDKMFNMLISKLNDVTISILIQQEEVGASFSKELNYIDITIAKDKIYDFYKVDGNKVLIDKGGYKRYEGDIKKGKLNGYGIAYNGDGRNYYEANQIIYKGNWKDGLWNGNGQSYSLKETIESQINSPIMSGFTEQEIRNLLDSHKNIVFYDTTYENGLRNGKFTRYDDRGNIYDVGVSERGIDVGEKYGRVSEGKYVSLPVLKEPTLGMTEDQVINSTWGRPYDRNKTTTKYRVSEQWVYSGYRYIYFDNGIVTAIQE
jgi:hypothetical protein